MSDSTCSLEISTIITKKKQTSRCVKQARLRKKQTFLDTETIMHAAMRLNRLDLAQMLTARKMTPSNSLGG
jgi:hypothetical protein